METYIPIHSLVKVICENRHIYDEHQLTSALLCAYVITGCDTVSYPYRRSKKSAVKVTLNHIDQLDFNIEYGDHSVDLTEEVMDNVRLLFVVLYVNIYLHQADLTYDHYHQQEMPSGSTFLEHFISTLCTRDQH